LGGYSGNISVNNSTGVVSLTNAAPGGATVMINIVAMDNCGVTTTTPATIKIKINAPPSVAVSSPAVRQGSSPVNQLIANISDPEDPVSALTVTNTQPLVATGVTVSNVTVNTTTGEVKADIAATCAATNASFTVTATDTNMLSTTATVMVTVLPNTPPVISYPANVTIGAGSASTTINPTSGPSDNGSVASLTRTSLMVTACGTVTVNSVAGPNFGQVTVTGAPVTQQTCTVTIQAVDNCGGAGGTTNASFNIKISAPSIGISKTHMPLHAAPPNDYVEPGETSTFVLNFSNTGDQDATSAVLTDVVPANTTFDATASSPGWSCPNNSPAGTTCTYNLGNIGAGGAGSVFFAVRVVNPVGPAVTQISNSFTYADSITPTKTSNTDTVNINAAADVTIAKTDNGVTSGAGQTILYFVSYSNVGRRDATNVIVTETVPANTTFNSGASSAGWNCNNGDPAGTTCTRNAIPLLAGGGAANPVLTFAVDVVNPLPPMVYQVTNTASISQAGVDPNPGNNSSTDTTPVGNGLIISPNAIGRTAGSAASNSAIATVTDALAPVSSVVVMVTSLPAGITVSNIINNSGVITADVAASCTAATGPNMVGLKATDNAGNMGTANLTVNVAANTAPVLSTYPATGPINPGTSAAVTPSAAPTDNGSIANIVASAPGFTGTFSVNPATGVVNVSNAGPSGTFTVTVTATDNCGLTATQTFTLVVNTPPTITPAGPLSFSQGSTTTGVTVATVGDINTPAGSLIVTMDSAPPGILLTGFINSGGTITANVAVSCTAALGGNTVVLKVTDGGGLTTNGNLIINVTPNTAPVQGNYSASSVNSGAGTTITPSAVPTDNGIIASIVATAPGFTGGFSVNTATGVITVTNAGPMGMFTVTVTATDNCGLTSTKTFTLTVNCSPITVTSPGVATGTVNTPFSQTFTQSGGVGTVTFTTASTLPTGLILLANGNLSGTPTVPGTFPITVTATDSNGCTGTSLVYTLVIACQTITVNPPPVATGTVGVSFSQNFAQAGGVGAVSFTLNTGTIPTGLTLAANGVLSGIPTQSGTFPITAKVTDANGCMGISATYTLVINCQNIAVTPPAVTTGTVSAVFSQSFTQQGAVGTANFTLNSGTLPTGLTLSSSGILSGIPTQPGNFPITVKVTDSNGCMGTGATYTLVIGCQTITVTPPAVTTGTANALFSQTFTQSAGLGTVTFTLNTGTLPTGLTLAPNGVLSGTPTQTGNFNITVKATDVNGCTGISASYTLIINCQVITVTPPATTTGTIGAAFSQTFTQTNAIGAVTFSINSGSLPPGLTLAANGQVTGTPTALGSYPVTVKVTDANGCIGISATTTFVITCQTITVTPPAVTTGTVGTAFSQSFTQTGAIGAFTFSLNSGTLPTGLTFSTAGLLSGTPTQFGAFPLTVKVTDSNGCMGVSAIYNLVINCQTINVTPPAVTTATVGVAFNQSFTQAGALGGASFTLNSGTIAPGLVLGLNGQLSGTPTQAGSFPITVKVTDGNGCTGISATYTLVVACPTITFAPATLPNGTYGDAYNQTVTASPGGVYNYAVTAGALPTGLSLNATSGAITGIPTAVGSYPFTITATYYTNCPATKTYTIVIDCPTITFTPANLVTGTIGVAYSQTVTAIPAGTYNYTVMTGTLPPGVTLNAATGVISGTPTLIGTYNITIKATGSGGLNGCTGTKDYTIIINCRTVTVSPTTLPGGKVADPYSQTISASPAAVYVFSVSNGSLPPGLSLNTTSGVISGTPTQPGTFTFTIKATDPDTCAGTQGYSVIISCPTIVLSPATLPTGTIGGPYPATTFTAAPAGAYSFAITSGTLPAGLTLTSGGLLSGTPTQAGSFPITVTATDANLCTGSRSYTLVINLCPQISIEPQTLPAAVSGSAYSQTLTAIGGTAPYTFTLTGSLPIGMSLSSAGVLSGTPSQTGSFPITVTAKDANNCTGVRPYTLTSGLGCVFDLTPQGQGFTSAGGSATIAITTAGTCSWTAASNDSWIIINSGASGTGNGTVGYTVGVNATGNVRTGTIQVAGQVFTVTQSPDPNGLQYYPLPYPIRLLDTRAGQGNCDSVSTPIAAGTSITKQSRITCEGLTIPQNAQAITGNVTVINQTAQTGYLTLYPDGQAAPLAANMIYGPGGVLSNNFTVGLSASGAFNIFGERTIDVVVDISGYYAPPGATGLYYHPLPKPIRLLDTRPGQGNCDSVSTPITGGTSLSTLARTTCEGLTIPAAAQAIAGNATVINPSAQPGYLTIYPQGVPAPLAANLVYQPGQVLSNAFTVGLGVSGEFNIFGERTIDMVVDVAGYYSSEPVDANGPGLFFTPLARPLRILDTRAGQGNCDSVSTPITGGSSITAQGRLTCESLTIPTSAQAVLGNVTVINQTAASGYLTLFPDGVAQPLAANMIYSPNQILSNSFVVGLNSITGQFRIFAERTLDAIVDVSGYFAP
jgi:uncharacterized repeat protein (TIGR01451 family)